MDRFGENFGRESEYDRKIEAHRAADGLLLEKAQLAQEGSLLGELIFKDEKVKKVLRKARSYDTELQRLLTEYSQQAQELQQFLDDGWNVYRDESKDQSAKNGALSALNALARQSGGAYLSRKADQIFAYCEKIGYTFH